MFRLTPLSRRPTGPPSVERLPKTGAAQPPSVPHTRTHQGIVSLFSRLLDIKQGPGIDALRIWAVLGRSGYADIHRKDPPLPRTELGKGRERKKGVCEGRARRVVLRLDAGSICTVGHKPPPICIRSTGRKKVFAPSRPIGLVRGHLPSSFAHGTQVFLAVNPGSKDRW